MEKRTLRIAGGDRFDGQAGFEGVADRGGDDENPVGHDHDQHLELTAGAFAVGVQAGAEDEIHAVPGHQNRGGAEDGTDVQAEIAEPGGIAAVEDQQIGDQGD